MCAVLSDFFAIALCGSSLLWVMLFCVLRGCWIPVLVLQVNVWVLSLVNMRHSVFVESVVEHLVLVLWIQLVRLRFSVALPFQACWMCSFLIALFSPSLFSNVFVLLCTTKVNQVAHIWCGCVCFFTMCSQTFVCRGNVLDRTANTCFVNMV